MDRRRIFVLTESWNPFEIFLLVACILSGFTGIFAPEKASAAVQEILDSRVLQMVYYVGLAVGGCIALYGFVRNLFIERIGITLISGIILGYLLIILSTSPRSLAQALFMTFAFFAACVVRIIQITRLLKR